MAFSQSLFADAILNLPGDLSRQVMVELCRGFRAQEVLAAVEQKELAVAQGEHRAVDGLGQKTMSLTPYSYHYWGQRLGYACWRDKGFRREFLRDNPEARVRTVARTTTLRVEGRRAEGSRLKAEGKTHQLEADATGLVVNGCGK